MLVVTSVGRMLDDRKMGNRRSQQINKDLNDKQPVVQFVKCYLNLLSWNAKIEVIMWK